MEREYLIYDPEDILREDLEHNKYRVVSNLNASSVLKYKQLFLLLFSVDSISILEQLEGLNKDSIVVLSDQLTKETLCSLTSSGISRIMCIENATSIISVLIKNIVSIAEREEGFVRVDELRNLLLIGQYKVRLTNSELLLIKSLEINEPRSIDQIKLSIGKSDVENTRVAISRLRNKIYEQTGIQAISNLYGKGYYLRSINPF